MTYNNTACGTIYQNEQKSNQFSWYDKTCLTPSFVCDQLITSLLNKKVINRRRKYEVYVQWNP